MSDPVGNELLRVSRSGAIATITLNRPEVSNALASESYTAVAEALEACGRDPEVRVVVITGEGKHFSVGGDIRKFRGYIESGTFIQRENVIRAGRMTQAVRTCPKPVIAMVNGAAAGAGCALALSCDFRIMTPKSKLGMSFINMGLSGDTGCMCFLERMVGAAKACELMMLGSMVDGQEALRLGLASRLVPEEQLQAETLALAEQLARMPTQAIARQKRLSYEFFYRDLAQFNLREADYMYETSRTPDYKEAVYAFLEKRKPEFTGQ